MMLPVLFVGALRGNDFVWRGNAMQVESMRPVRIAVRFLPRMIELAALGRQRLRALRAGGVLIAFSARGGIRARLEHEPEKACPRTLIRGWEPVFRKDHAPTTR